MKMSQYKLCIAFLFVYALVTIGNSFLCMACNLIINFTIFFIIFYPYLHEYCLYLLILKSLLCIIILRNFLYKFNKILGVTVFETSNILSTVTNFSQFNLILVCCMCLSCVFGRQPYRFSVT